MDTFKVFSPCGMPNRKSICRPFTGTMLVTDRMRMVDVLKSYFVVERALAGSRTKFSFPNPCRNNIKTITTVGTG